MAYRFPQESRAYRDSLRASGFLCEPHHALPEEAFRLLRVPEYTVFPQGSVPDLYNDMCPLSYAPPAAPDTFCRDLSDTVRSPP